MEDNLLFDRQETILKQGLVIDVIAMNQISNGNQKKVEKGIMPLITFTVNVMDITMEDVLFTISCDSFKEAFETGVEFAEQHLKKGEL